MMEQYNPAMTCYQFACHPLTSLKKIKNKKVLGEKVYPHRTIYVSGDFPRYAARWNKFF